ncbi:PPC domain-containing protein [Treponema primitia]|uniref:PPC domain-containing protein n=1 Tax=Treponema primitia TaxID=88058 RepID=UPI00025557D3|nr:PPC domain-containing protein [Treponema primitia]
MNYQPKRVLFGLLLAAFLSAPLFAQSPAAVETLEQLDGEAAKLGAAIIQKLGTLGTGLRIRFGEFSFEGTDTSLGTYLTNQLAAVLVKAGGSGYTIITGPVTASTGENAYTLSGEILQLGANIRVYTKLTRSQDSSLGAVWNTDFTLSSFIEDLTAVSSPSSSNRVRRDSYETDSRDAPVAAAIGAWISRTIHEGDEDWFQVSSDRAGVLVLETSNSSFDPYMELYDESGYNQLDEDDDGGDNSNPRIEVNAEAGQVFIVKVRGYGSSETGDYRFRANLEAVEEDATEPNDSIEQATLLELGSGPLSASLRSRSDVDFYRLEIPAAGRLTVYTESRMDTLLTLYDGEGEIIDEDDDSGNGGNARISRDVPAGTVYIKVRGYDGERGSYTLHFEY